MDGLHRRKQMRRLYILIFTANLILTLISLRVLPERVAIHFGGGGWANGWASKFTSALLMTGLQILIFCALYFFPRLIISIPSRWTNLPNKDYWLKPENRTRTKQILEHLMWRFGTVLFLLFLIMGLLTLQANMSDPVRLNMNVFFLSLAAFLIYTIWWVIKLLRAFQIPSGVNGNGYGKRIMSQKDGPGFKS